jgi:hypothetical protein
MLTVAIVQCQPSWSAAGDVSDFEGIVSRATAYVAEYESSLQSVIADERYFQEMTPQSRSYYAGRRNVVARRWLHSQFLIVQVPTSDEWLGFRDVLSVDDRPVPDHSASLQELIDLGSGTDDAWRRVFRDGARYNIGDVMRTVNVPTFALVVLRASNRSRFRFTAGDRARVSDVDTLAIEFEEVGRPTMIRTTTGGDLPARGAVWVQPDAAAVVQTDLQTHDAEHDLRSRIKVRYRRDAALGLWVPRDMDERYDLGPKAGALQQQINCLATYTRFRRVSVDARIR